MSKETEQLGGNIANCLMQSNFRLIFVLVEVEVTSLELTQEIGMFCLQKTISLL